MKNRLTKKEVLCQINWTDNDEAGVWFFAMHHLLARSFEVNVRKAIADWLKIHPHTHSWNYNWGDAITDISSEHWALYGLRLLPEEPPTFQFTVDHNESLAKPE